MLRLCLGVLAIGWVWLPLAARAAVVEVQYTITGGTATGGVGGLETGTITGGNAKVVFPNTGSGSPPLTNVAASLASFTLTITNTGGTYTFQPPTLPITGLGTKGAAGTLFALLHITAPACPSGFSMCSRKVVLAANATGALSGAFSFYGNTGETLSTNISVASFTGQEVMVPEPGAFPFMAMGGVLLAAYGWRRLRA